jgi:hypothetical protein
MKTSELIQRLQLADPSGELECTVGKTDIHFVHQIPCYYDGHVEILKRDPALEGECYNIVGAEIRGKGSHVSIETHSIREMLCDEPEMPVTYDSESAERSRATVEKWREEFRKMDAEITASLQKSESN